MLIQRSRADMATVANRPFSGEAESSAAVRAAAAIVQILDPASCPDLGVALSSHPGYSIFHTAVWAKALEASYGYKPLYLTVEEGGKVRSLLPLMEVNSRLTGRRGIALPFTDECAPLYQDHPLALRLMQSAIALGKSRGWKSVEFRGGRELCPEAPASVSFYGHRLNLEGGDEAIFARFDSSTRRSIRKAEKSGVTVTMSGEIDAVKIFYSLHCKTRRKHGLPPQPFIFFSNICHHILSRGLGMVVVASWQNQPIAASVYFRMGARAIYKFGASDETHQELRGTNIVMWEAIKHLAHNGVTTLDFGRTSMGNEGLRRFKTNWGTHEYKIEYVKYDLRRDAFVTERDMAAGWHNWVFRVMPSGVSRLIGATLYKHLA